jgi:hypothetical protein
MPQYLRPTQDIVSGGWIPSSGGYLYGTINESIMDNNVYNTSSTNPTSDISAFKLDSGLNPVPVLTGYTYRYTYRKSNTKTRPINVSAALYDSGVLIREDIQNDVSNTWSSGEIKLSIDEVNQINDFKNLSFKTEAFNNSLNDGLLYYWDLDETGTLKKDHINSANLDMYNLSVPPSISTSGILDGNAVRFTGSYYFRSTGYLPLYPTSSFSFSFWTYFNNLPTCGLISAEDQNDYCLNVYINSNLINHRINNAGATGCICEIPLTGLLNRWNHVFGYLDKERNIVGISINNSIDDTAPITTFNNVDQTGVRFFVGSRSNGLIASSGVEISNVGIWNRVIDPDERTKLYNLGVGRKYPFADKYRNITDNLVAYWKLDETAGTRYDSWGDYHLTDNNTVGYAKGLQGNCAQFDMAANEYLSIANTNLFAWEGNPTWTMTAWIMMNDTGTDQFLITNVSNPDGCPRFSYNATTPPRSFYFSAHGNSAGITGLQTGTWYFVAMKDEKGFHYIKCNNDSWVGPVPNVDPVFTGLTTFGLGLGYWGAVGFSGKMEDVMVWKNRILTDSEISGLYNYGLGKKINLNNPEKTNLRQGLVSYWPLDEVSGIRKDIIRGNNLIPYAIAPYNIDPPTTSGLFGRAIRFTGAANVLTGEYLNPYLNITGHKSFTWTYWLNINKDTGLYNWYFIGFPNQLFRINASQPPYYVENDGINSFTAMSTEINLSGWNFITCSYDAFLGKTFYKLNNGPKYQYGPIKFMNTGDWSVWDNAAPSPNKMTLNSYAQVYPKSGDLSHLAFWDRCLSEYELNLLYNGGTGLVYPFDKQLSTLNDGILAHWKLDELGGTRYDSARNNHLTDNNTVMAQSGRLGNSAFFDSINTESLSLANANKIPMSTFSRGLSFSYWMNANVQTGVNQTMLRIDTLYRIAVVSMLNYDFYGGQPNRISAMVDNSYVSIPFSGQSGWVHVVATVGDANSTTKLHINGQLLETAPGTRVVGANQNENIDNLYIGNNLYGGQSFSGNLDSFSLWNRELTSGEVKELYNNGLGLDYPFYKTGIY